jgi:pre-rRNA-processing protein TSR1
VADFVVLILSANQEVDKHGELILRSIEAQGISNTIPVAQVFSSCGRFLPARTDRDCV